MSRRGWVLSVTLAATAWPAAAQESDAMAVHRERTRAAITCDRSAAGDDVVVCANRDADRYRVPFVTLSPDSPDNVPVRTARLLEDTSFECSVTGPFFARCGGMVGVTAKVGSDGQVTGLRPLAP